MGKFKAVNKAAVTEQKNEVKSSEPLSINDKHLLYNGNAISIMDSMIKSGQRVNMIFTDPPYRNTPRGWEGNSGGMFKKKEIKSGKVFNFNDLEIEDWLPRFYDILNDNCHCYIMINDKNLSHYLRVIEDSKFHFIKCLIWVKNNKIMGTSYMSQHEYIIMLRKGGFRRLNNNSYSDVLSVACNKLKGADGKNLHDTEKPVELLDILIGNSSSEGEIVLDPFMGIGGCGVSCEKLGRKFIGIEIDKNYFDVAAQRIKV